MSKQPRPLFQVLEHFSLIFPMSLLCSVYSGSLRGRLHRFAMETCSARIDPHTVFALAPRVNRLKHALTVKRLIFGITALALGVAAWFAFNANQRAPKQGSRCSLARKSQQRS